MECRAGAFLVATILVLGGGTAASAQPRAAPHFLVPAAGVEEFMAFGWGGLEVPLANNDQVFGLALRRPRGNGGAPGGKWAGSASRARGVDGGTRVARRRTGRARPLDRRRGVPLRLQALRLGRPPARDTSRHAVARLLALRPAAARGRYRGGEGFRSRRRGGVGDLGDVRLRVVPPPRLGASDGGAVGGRARPRVEPPIGRPTFEMPRATGKDHEAGRNGRTLHP